MWDPGTKSNSGKVRKSLSEVCNLANSTNVNFLVLITALCVKC